jgi:multidrug efflux pump subunit AcrA (membrane-fusion protein)
MEAAASSARQKRVARLWLAGSIAALLAVLVLAVAGYWAYCQALPPYTPPRVQMPSPNAYDDYVAAPRRLPADRRDTG